LVVGLDKTFIDQILNIFFRLWSNGCHCRRMALSLPALNFIITCMILLNP
jgi:hypothetical protein